MRTIPWIGLLMLTSALAAQEVRTAPVEVKDARVWEHRTAPEEVLHRGAQEMDDLKKGRMGFAKQSGQCLFEVVVTAGGAAESLKSLKSSSPCGPHEEEAEGIVRSRLYTPWMVDGAPARVRIQDWVNVYPPERWGEATPFPEKVDMKTVKITLERTLCFGSCPAYTVSVRGDGSVEFDGQLGVRLPGRHTGHVEAKAVAELVEAFREANFLSALPVYRGNWTDNPTQTLTLAMNGTTKKVVDYVGLDAGLPWTIKQLEAEVDKAAESERWVKGSADAMSLLAAEHWDFAANTPSNMALFRKAIDDNDAELLAAYVRVKAPAATAADHKAPPLCEASRRGNEQLVSEMLAYAKTVPAELKNRCLVDAVQSGNEDLVNLWLEKGADPKAQVKLGEEDDDWLVRSGALAGAIQSGNAGIVREMIEYKVDVNAKIQEQPALSWALERGGQQAEEIAQLLLDAGANANARNFMGETPLFACMYSPEAIKPLLAAGADLEARANYGDTVLIRYAFSEPMVRTLLAAGADVHATGRLGQTALDRARHSACPRCVTLLEEALNKSSATKN